MECHGKGRVKDGRETSNWLIWVDSGNISSLFRGKREVGSGDAEVLWILFAPN